MNYPAPGATVDRRALPNVTDPTTAPFWEASKRQVLVAQRCTDCGDTRFPYLDLCPKCWSENQEWVEVAPTGELWTFVVYRRALDPTKNDEIPYVIGRVVTDDGPIFNVRLDIAPEEAKVGMRLTATWDDVTDDVTLLRFGPVEG
jgi:uncharacterized OB-fold protein